MTVDLYSLLKYAVIVFDLDAVHGIDLHVANLLS